MAKGERGTAKPYLRGKVWWIKYYVPGERKPRRESSKSKNKTIAVRLLNQRKAEIDRGTVAGGEPSIDHLLELYLSDQRKNKRKGSRNAENYIKAHLRPAFGKEKASKLGTAALDRFIGMKRAAGLSDGTINRILAALKRGYNLGREAKPPLVFAMPNIELLEEDNVREGFLEHSQYVIMRDLLPDHQKTLLVIGYHIGMRSGEIIALRWDQVDWHHNLIRLEKKQTKGKQARVAPLYGELRAWLEMAHAARGTCTFIVSYQDQGITEYKRAWNTARMAAGLPDLKVHDLRRTAVRNMVRAGIPEKQAMRISGHKTRAIFDRYDITDERDIQLAGDKLAVYLQQLAVAQKVGTKVGTAGEEANLKQQPKGITLQ